MHSFLYAHFLCSHDVICVCSLCAWDRKNASKFVDVNENDRKTERDRERGRMNNWARKPYVWCTHILWFAGAPSNSITSTTKSGNLIIKKCEKRMKNKSSNRCCKANLMKCNWASYIKIEESRRSKRRQIVNDNVSKLSQTQTQPAY